MHKYAEKIQNAEKRKKKKKEAFWIFSFSNSL